jgi:hypothetical protein
MSGPTHTCALAPALHIGKRVAETLTMDYNREHATEVRIVRIFNTYGPRMALDDGRVVSNFVAQVGRQAGAGRQAPPWQVQQPSQPKALPDALRQWSRRVTTSLSARS